MKPAMQSRTSRNDDTARPGLAALHQEVADNARIAVLDAPPV